MGEWTVYRHIFPNNKNYIGITSMKPKYRWGKNGYGYKTQKLIFNAINEYGWDNIQHLILFENLTIDEARIKEQELIQEYHSYYLDPLGPGYNMTLGGEGAKIIDSNLIIKMYQDGLTTYQIADLTKHDRGIISNILKNNNVPLRQNSKYINQFDLNGNYIATYLSAQAAENATKTDRKLISGVIRGIAKSSNGFQWRYYNEEDINGIPPIQRQHGGNDKRKVNQYNLDGTFIKTFDSITEAAQEIGCERSNIRAAAQGKTKYSHGYKWCYAEN